MNTKTRVKTLVQITIDNNDIISILTKASYIPENAKNISITFTVPGGGDYSNTILDIDKTNPIEVSYDLVEEY